MKIFRYCLPEREISHRISHLKQFLLMVKHYLICHFSPHIVRKTTHIYSIGSKVIGKLFFFSMWTLLFLRFILPLPPAVIELLYLRYKVAFTWFCLNIAFTHQLVVGQIHCTSRHLQLDCQRTSRGKLFLIRQLPFYDFHTDVFIDLFIERNFLLCVQVYD